MKCDLCEEEAVYFSSSGERRCNTCWRKDRHKDTIRSSMKLDISKGRYILELQEKHSYATR